ncbi:MAG: UDP-glucose 4-epimerase GalE [Pseudomonadota bacterium]
MAMIGVVGASSYEGRQMLLTLADRGLPHLGFDSADCETLRADEPLIKRVDLSHPGPLTELFRQHAITDVVHLPDRGTVTRSLKDPLDAYENTLVPLMSVLRAVTENGIKRMVLSSTASVYGVPTTVPVPESSPLQPISPLGWAALSAERMTSDACKVYGIERVILRYFNAAGADPIGRSGEASAPKHLITAAVQVATGRREGPLKIYGDDYDTPDGTAIRDYVHVADVASAHVDAIDHLRAGGSSVILNCGYGEGVSVQEVVQSVERVMGQPMPIITTGRRQGDPPQLIADTAAIRSMLGWRPQYNDLDLIIRTAIAWESQSGAETRERA